MVRVGMESSICTEPRLYGVDLEDDVTACIEYINKRFDNPALYAFGESMGAAALCKLSSSLGKKNKYPFKA